LPANTCYLAGQHVDKWTALMMPRHREKSDINEYGIHECNCYLLSGVEKEKEEKEGKLGNNQMGYGDNLTI
jgi:hypothetical protein